MQRKRNSMEAGRSQEIGPASTPLLEKFREELEGLSTAKIVIVRKASIRTRVKKIRNAHVARCGSVFFRMNFFGFIESHPSAGRKLIKKLFMHTQQKTS